MCIHCHRAHDWLSLMDICHASDSVPKRFQRQRSSFKTSRTRRMQASFCRELAGGGSPRVPLILPTAYPLTPTTPSPRPSAHQRSQAYCGDLATTALFPRWISARECKRSRACSSVSICTTVTLHKCFATPRLSFPRRSESAGPTALDCK